MSQNAHLKIFKFISYINQSAVARQSESSVNWKSFPSFLSFFFEAMWSSRYSPDAAPDDSRFKVSRICFLNATSFDWRLQQGNRLSQMVKIDSHINMLWKTIFHLWLLWHSIVQIWLNHKSRYWFAGGSGRCVKSSVLKFFIQFTMNCTSRHVGLLHKYFS